jgi:hypothetical protein
MSLEFLATVAEGSAGKIGIFLIVRARQHTRRYTLKQRPLEISKLAQYAYGDCRIGWN